MFALPQGDRAVEGRSDENPIILSGDKVSEFKNFLWALYALCVDFKCISSIPRPYYAFSGLPTFG
jgi:hypothetical protein